MKAAQINEYGDTSVIQINEVEKPEPAAGQLLIEVHAASLNPFDTTVRSGALKDSMPLQFPLTLGGDIAGVVTAISEGVEGFAVGDRVYGQAAVVAGNSGAFAEYAVTKHSQVAKAPKNLHLTEAASLPLVGVSAFQALTEHIGLQSGHRLFIHGGAGGIGSIAIQIAKVRGAYIVTTATGGGVSMVKQLGADEVIDFTERDFSEELRGFDAVFDTVGHDDFNKALGILKNGGRAVSMTAHADEAKAAALGVTAITQATRVTTEKLDSLAELVESGSVKPQVGKVFPFNQIQAAFSARESGTVNGKVVIELIP